MRKTRSNKIHSRILRRLQGSLTATALAALLTLIAPIGRAATFFVAVGGDAPVFSPSTIKIQPGDTVNWVWESIGISHSVVSGVNGHPDGLFDSGIHKDPFTFSFTFPNAGTFPYYCEPHLSMGMVGTVIVEATTPTPTPSPTATPAQPLNISTRMQVRTEDQVLIGGFIITGTEPKEVVFRAIGPSLAAFGIANPLADPVLELRAADGSLIAMNDNWKDTQQAEIEASGFMPASELESVILRTLAPESYTAIMSGKNGGTGVGLVEGYDLETTTDSALANISTRGFVDTGSNVLIGGFILGAGDGSTTVVIRAVGPSLTQFGVTDALADPTLELRDGDGTLVQDNDNWNDTLNKTELVATGLQPGDNLESAIFASLPAGAYTAIVAGRNATAGVGLVEVYRLQ